MPQRTHNGIQQQAGKETKIQSGAADAHTELFSAQMKRASILLVAHAGKERIQLARCGAVQKERRREYSRTPHPCEHRYHGIKNSCCPHGCEYNRNKWVRNQAANGKIF